MLAGRIPNVACEHEAVLSERDPEHRLEAFAGPVLVESGVVEWSAEPSVHGGAGIGGHVDELGRKRGDCEPGSLRTRTPTNSSGSKGIDDSASPAVPARRDGWRPPARRTTNEIGLRILNHMVSG